MTIAARMQPISYTRYQFPPAVIQHAVWFYRRFTFSYRDVEDLLAERGLDITYETVPQWVLKFGAAIVRNLRRLLGWCMEAGERSTALVP
jgi:putative transposase